MRFPKSEMSPSRSRKFCVSIAINLSFLVYLALRPKPAFHNTGNNSGAIHAPRSLLVRSLSFQPSMMSLEPIFPSNKKTNYRGHNVNREMSTNSTHQLTIIEPMSLITENYQLESFTSLNTPNSYDSTKIFPCDDFTPHRYIGQRGTYWVLYNYFKATKTFRCDQSITYTTHTDWTYLDNLFPLLERWEGPLSVTLYAPGTDFEDSLKRIQYLRECTSSRIIKELVTFHLFFDQLHMPLTEIPHDPEQLPVNCTHLKSTITFGEELKTYKKLHSLLYPINVGRNVAKEMATTHYVFPSDIELYTNPNLIPDFLQMIKSNETLRQGTPPKVFVFSLFELDANVTVLPYDKRDLIRLLKNKSAIPFHKYVCPDCHILPKAKEWLEEPFQKELRVIHVAKKLKKNLWEPLYIGTKFEPMYDERLYWEGKKDKMVQSYLLCVLDYEFHILNNAFLVHKPGIKGMTKSPKKNPVPPHLSTLQYKFISTTILPELRQIYGTRLGCDM